jgi:hypothetical protein
MGDQAPPNFNPSVSLLHGGESARIMPVQGGGFNPDATLLSGGEGATIQAIKGGANNDENENGNGGVAEGLKKTSIFQKIKKSVGWRNKQTNKGLVDEEEEEEEKKEENEEEEKKEENEEEEEENEEEENEDEEEDEDEDENENNENSEEVEENENENRNNNFEEELPGTSTHDSKDVKIHIDGITFEIRPFDEDTYVEWQNGNYSENEKKFMDAIELTEDLLQETFGLEWMEKVADFFKNLVNASCFKDSVLLTKKECEDTREFTKKIHLKLYERLLKKMRGPEPEKEVENQEEENSNTTSVKGLNNNGMVEANISQEGGRRGLPSIGGFKSLQL